MMKNFRPNKNGAYWSIWNHNTWWKWRREDYEFIEFYPFPTLRLRYNGDTLDTGDHSFDIEFIWLFWEVLITRYWGKAYEDNLKRMIRMEMDAT